MKKLWITLIVELLKLRRSKIVMVSFIFFMFIPMMMSLMFLIQKHPEIATKLGMIGTKATLMRLGSGDWQAYLGFVTQGMAGIGLIGFGFITSWIFGREFLDRTVKDMIALPISRSYFVVSKFIIIIIWSILLMLIYFISALISGNFIGISGWSNEIIMYHTQIFMETSLLTILLCTPVGFLASYSRGYLLPMGFVILTMIMANFSGLVGLGPFFPWSIPGLLGVPAGTEGMELTLVSFIILKSTSIIGFVGTLAWWKFADQH